MIIFKVYEKNETEKDNDIYLKLTRSYGKGSVTLVSCKEDGKSPGYGNEILTITSDGTLRLHGNCGVPGIKTDAEGKIIE